MNAFKDSLAAGSDWYNQRPIRERVLIVVTACVLVFVAGWELLVTPVDTRQQQLNNRLQSLTANRNNLISQQETLNSQLATDPSEEQRQRLETRQGRLQRLEQHITETTGQLIAPRDMVTLLRDMLTVQGGYLDVLAYLRRLEGLDERLGWMSGTTG